MTQKTSTHPPRRYTEVAGRMRPVIRVLWLALSGRCTIHWLLSVLLERDWLRTQTSLMWDSPERKHLTITVEGGSQHQTMTMALISIKRNFVIALPRIFNLGILKFFLCSLSIIQFVHIQMFTYASLNCNEPMLDKEKAQQFESNSKPNACTCMLTHHLRYRELERQKVLCENEKKEKILKVFYQYAN
jgi:hypothetical protein